MITAVTVLLAILLSAAALRAAIGIVNRRLKINAIAVPGALDTLMIMSVVTASGWAVGSTAAFFAAGYLPSFVAWPRPLLVVTGVGYVVHLAVLSELLVVYGLQDLIASAIVRIYAAITFVITAGSWVPLLLATY